MTGPARGLMSADEEGGSFWSRSASQPSTDDRRAGLAVSRAAPKPPYNPSNPPTESAMAVSVLSAAVRVVTF